jgi:cytoskeletal protein RodZ
MLRRANSVAMASVGEMLRMGREAQKLTLQKAAEATKIRSDYLEAIEAGNYNRFVAPVYIRGFVRTYAMWLKLDMKTVMATLDQELSKTEKFHEAPPLDPTRRGPLDQLTYLFSRVNWIKTGLGLGALLLIAGLAAGFYAWRQYAKTDPLAGMKPALFQPTQDVSGASQPLPPGTTRKP